MTVGSSNRLKHWSSIDSTQILQDKCFLGVDARYADGEGRLALRKNIIEDTSFSKKYHIDEISVFALNQEF